MNKSYFIVPAVLLGIFIFYYSGFVKEYEAAHEAEIVAAKEARIEAMKKEAADREKAIKDALALNAQRKAEREAKEAEELARKEARQAASDALDLARSERKRLKDRVDALKADVGAVEAKIEEIKLDKERLAGEAEFLRSYVTIAQNNEKEFQAVLQDIRKAEQAHAAALVAAAAAEK